MFHIPRLVLAVLLLLSFNCNVIAQSNKSSLKFEIDPQLVEQITNLVVNNIDTIKIEYSKTEGLRCHPFAPASLFVLSDVCLANWQLENINQSIFKTAYSNGLTSENSRNIFEQRTEKIGKYLFGIYGNRLCNINFSSLDKRTIQSVFGISPENSLEKTKEHLLDELIQYSVEYSYRLPQNLIDGFNELGLIHREIMSTPVLTNADNNALFNIAGIITVDLISILERQQSKVKSSYAQRSRKQDISYQEYFNAWDKSLVKEATNMLVDLGYIKIPTPRNFIICLDD